MNLTVEEKLAQLQADHEAQTALLTEASAKIETLTAQNESLKATADAATAQVTALQTQVADLTTKNAELSEAQADFNARVRAEACMEAARIAASCGTSTPARVTGTADGRTITRAELHEMTPEQRMEHFRRGGKLID